MTTDFSLRAETHTDAEAIDDVHLKAFGPDEAIGPLVRRLRQIDTPFATDSIVAQSAGGEVLGHVMLSHSWLDTPERLIDILVFAPLGVTPKAQGMGIGTALISHAIKRAKGTSAPILFLEGNPAYYGPRGFEAAQPRGIRSPSLRIPEPALQMVRLPSYRPEMTGTLVYREVWWELDCVGLR